MTTTLRKNMKPTLELCTHRVWLPYLWESMELFKGVEVGVFEGEFLEHIDREPLEVEGVDPYMHFDSGYDDPCNLPQEQMDAMYERVSENHNIVRATSVHCARYHMDNSLGWVYIDANHSEASVREDIAAWWPKIRSGGMLCGHDYTTQFPWVHVIPAVDDFVAKNNLKLHVMQCTSWAVMKP